MGGARPLFCEKYPPSQELQDFITDCWAAEPDKRPTARDLSTRLKQIADMQT
jgi:hypothetical protein